MRIPAISEAINIELRKLDPSRKEKTTSKAPLSDKTELSDEAKRLSATQALTESITAQAAASPEVRQEKIAEAREKIEKGFYYSEEVADKVAENLLSEFGIHNPKK